MTAEPGTCLSEDNLAKAIEIMRQRDCGFVPVADENGKVIGTITDRDAAFFAASENKQLSKIKAGDLIGKRIIVCNADDKSEDALKKMRRYKIKRLPVVDENGKLVGVLSISDVLLKGKKLKKEVLKVLKHIAKPRPIVLKAIAEEN